MIPQSRNAEDPDASTPTRKLYPVPEVAKQLGGITERMVWTLIARGDLKSVRVGSRRLVTAEALDAFVKELVP